MNRRHRCPLSFACALTTVLSFAVGVGLRDVAQDWRDQEQQMKLIAQVRSCMYYVVVDARGKMECRAMVPRYELSLPFRARSKKRGTE